MSAEVVLTHVESGAEIWKGTAAEARASKSLSKEVVRMVDKTSADGIERIGGQWNTKRL